MKQDLNDLIGTKVGRLTVVRFLRTEKTQHKDRLRTRYIYECQCECGKISEVNRPNLKGGYTLSCGCLQKEKSLLGHEKQKGQIRTKLRKPNGESALRSTFLSYQVGATKRKLAFELSFEEFGKLTKGDCAYCGTEPKAVWKNSGGSSEYVANGVDRVNPNVGYVASNCVPCCKICNYMKHKLSEQEFFNHIKRIVSFRELT